MTLFRASKSERQYFRHIIFSKSVFEFATGNVDWRLSRVPRRKINNAACKRATADLVREIVVGTRMKMLSFTQEYIYVKHNLWCMLPQFPVHLWLEHSLFVWSRTYFSRSLALGNFSFAIYSDSLIYCITPTQSILNTSDRRHEISTAEIWSYIYEIKIVGILLHFISKETQNRKREIHIKFKT